MLTIAITIPLVVFILIIIGIGILCYYRKTQSTLNVSSGVPTENGPDADPQEQASADDNNDTHYNGSDAPNDLNEANQGSPLSLNNIVNCP